MMSHWPPDALEIARLQEKIQATPVSERTEEYARLAKLWGVSPSTIRSRIPVGGDRKERVDAGVSKAAIPEDAEAQIRGSRDRSPGAAVKVLENAGAVEEGAISRDQARRIQRGETRILSHTDPPPPPEPMDFMSWCKEKIFIRGNPWSLDRHEYLREIYQALETEPYFVARKAVQVGLTTAVLAEGLYRCDKHGMTVVYFMPTGGLGADVSDDRVGRMLSESPDLEAATKERGRRGRDNKGLRHIGAGAIYMRGLFAETHVASIDADLVALDEIDIADQENRQDAVGRVEHSELQHIREICRPTVPEYGIDEIFQRSDQRYYHLICPECGERTCLDLALDNTGRVPIPQAFMRVPDGAAWAAPGQEYYRGCLSCQAPLDMSAGEWIPENPGARIRGYHVSALYTQVQSPHYPDPADRIMALIADADTTRKRRYVVTSIFGLPFGAGARRVTDKMLNRATGSHGFRSGDASYIGVDQGDILHVVVAEKNAMGALEIIGAYITDLWADLFDIYERHNGVMFVGDAMPEKSEMRRTAIELDGYICYYSRGKALTEGEEAGPRDTTVKKLTIDRADSLDETVRGLDEQAILLPNPKHLDDEELVTHEKVRGQLKRLTKVLKEDAQGITRWEYAKGVPNHFGMALNYARLAAEIGGAGEVEMYSPSIRAKKTQSYIHTRKPTPDIDGIYERYL